MVRTLRAVTSVAPTPAPAAVPPQGYQPPPPARPWQAPVTAGIAVVVGTVVLGVGNPNTTHVPLCPLHAATGLDCPFCGSLRAVHSLAHVDIAGALDHNIMFTLAVPFLIVGWVLWLARSLGRPLVARERLPRAVTVACWIIAITFGIVRNIPEFSWLGSGA